MNQEPIEESKHLEEPVPKSYFVFPTITNIAIIVLFFFTFCQVKSCSGDYAPVTGIQFLQRSIVVLTKSPLAFIVMSPLLASFLTAVLSLVFLFGNKNKLKKRLTICGLVGGLGISIFVVIWATSKGVILELPPIMIALLHFTYPLSRFFKTQPPPSGE
jgi:hypothetical protein